MYHFLSGYTAKVAGTERGLGNEPQAVFSTCFGAPFMVLPPRRYADLLGERLRRHHADAWLLNTGWTGGGFGQGERISLVHSRALVDAIINHAISDAPHATDPIFGLEYPLACPDVPSEILNPRTAWSDPAAFEVQAKRSPVDSTRTSSAFPAPMPKPERQGRERNPSCGRSLLPSGLSRLSLGRTPPLFGPLCRRYPLEPAHHLPPQRAFQRVSQHGPGQRANEILRPPRT